MSGRRQGSSRIVNVAYLALALVLLAWVALMAAGVSIGWPA